MKQVIVYLEDQEHAALKRRAKAAKRSIGSQLAIEAIRLAEADAKSNRKRTKAS